MTKTLSNIRFLIVILFCLFMVVSDAIAEVDIRVGEVSINPRSDDTYHQGEAMYVRFHIENMGDEPFSDFRAEFFAGNYLIGSKLVDVFDRTSYFEWLSLPDDIPSGEYIVSMQIYCTDDNNSDNDFSSADDILTITPKAPDLWITQLSPAGTPEGSLIHPGDDIVMRCKVKNVGDKASEGYTVDFAIGNIHLGTTSQNPLGIDASDALSETFKIPENIPNGSYRFSARVTCQNDDRHFGGDNSATTSSSYIVAEKGPTSILISSVITTSDYYHPDGPMAVIVDLKGVGGQLSADYEIEYYASTGAATADSSYLIGTDGGTLAPDDEDRVVTECYFPGDIPEGNYYITALVTWWHADEPKSREGQRSGLVWVGRCPDLEVTSVEPVEGTYGPGEEIVVYSLVQNIGDGATGPYTIDFYASVDTTISPSDYPLAYVERESLECGAQHSYNTRCNFPANIREGTYYIGAIARQSEPEIDIKNNTVCSSVTVDVVPSARYVSGRMQYRNFGIHPIRYARVKIYRDDHNTNPLDDHVVLETYTDHAGYFGILLPEAENGGPDIYARVFAEGAENAYPDISTKICAVKDDVFSQTYFMESPVYPYPQEAAMVINMTAVENEGDGEFMVYDSIVEGFHQARTYFGIELAEMTTFWPSEEGSYYDPCDHTIHISQDDRRDRDVIMHEYGHYVADLASFGQGSVGDNPNHYWDQDLRYKPVARTDEEARNLAFRESWATLFSVATQHGDTWNYWEDTKYHDRDEESGDVFSVNLEEDTADHDSPGEFYGNMNCCALWDIFDNYDFALDDNDVVSDVTLTKIWTVCQEYQPDDIIDFWNGWIDRFPDEQTEDMMRLFEDHEMPFVRPKLEPTVRPNTAPVAIAGEDQTVYQTYKDGAKVQFDASDSYDPDGDELTYRWYWNTDNWSIRGGGMIHPNAEVSLGVTTVTLEVYDGHVYAEDTMTITVLPTDPEDWIY